MQQNFSEPDKAFFENKISFIVGNVEIIERMKNSPSHEPFYSVTIDFLDDLSKQLRLDARSKTYPDILTLAFWIRKASVLEIKDRFSTEMRQYRLGRGIVFHISPSNVPINYMYSLVVGLLTGNHNVVRIPSKEFPQIQIINEALIATLERHIELKNDICLIRYERDREINDRLSAIADTRIIWGGDNTITEIRKSPLPPRSNEITFADRYSIAVIDSESYLTSESRVRIAEQFFNDTYLTDQNACSSPRIVVWMGEHIEEAKEMFWNELYQVVQRKYTFQPIQSVDKLTAFCSLAANYTGVHFLPFHDNRIVRVKIDELFDGLMNFKGNCGFFFEYDCHQITELNDLCNDNHCQTIAYLGNKQMLLPLIYSNVRGIDRVVPLGQTMNFDFIWDGYDLMSYLTRIINVI